MKDTFFFKPVPSIAAALCLIISVTTAQPELNFKRAVNIWPTIELYFTVECNGAPYYTFDKQNFEITENGDRVDDFTVWCYQRSGSLIHPHTQENLRKSALLRNIQHSCRFDTFLRFFRISS